MILRRVFVAGLAGGILASAAVAGRATTPEASGNPLWALPLHTLSATRERPIFTPSRRPPAKPVVAATQPPVPPPTVKPPDPDHPLLSMLGTVIGRGNTIVIVMEDASRNVLRLRAGQHYAGWVLRAVESRAARFEKDNRTATLTFPARSDERPSAVLTEAATLPRPSADAIPPAVPSSATPHRRRRD